MELSEQLSIVHTIAAQYWARELSALAEPLNAIEIIKHTGGKMDGFFPQFEGFSAVFFKVYFNNAFEYEMRGLQAVEAMVKVPGVITPTIVRVFPEHKAILSVKRDWDDTTTPIKRFFVGSLGIDWFKVGRWLRALHDTQISYTPNEKFLHRKFAKIDSHMADLRELFTHGQIEKMQAIVDQARFFFETEPIEWVLSHGDFGLDNIKVLDGVLEIIDFEDCQMAPREFDLLNCLVRLEYVTSFPHRSSTYRRLRNDFLNGYGPFEERTTCNNFTYLLIKLDALETYYRCRNNALRTSKKILIYSYFENQVKRQLNKWLATNYKENSIFNDSRH